MRQWEIEAIVQNPGVSEEKIKELLEGLGDSLVIGKSGTYCKIHIHTYSEKKVVDEIKKIGEIIELRKNPLP